jgi:hypothetical protein
METIEAVEDWHHGDGGSRKMLTAARRGMTRRAIPELSKVVGDQRGTVLQQEPLKEGRSGRDVKRNNNGIRNRGLKDRLCLGSKGNVNETYRETLGPEIAKKISGYSVRI